MGLPLPVRFSSLPVGLNPTPLFDQQFDASVDGAYFVDKSVPSSAMTDTGVTPAAYGSSTRIPSITTDAAGRITGASSSQISLADVTGILPTANGGEANVASVSAMAALDTTKSTVAFLTQGGRQGWFVWNPANLSSFVAVDTQQGVYVAPATAPTGVSGAWVRVVANSVSVKWFGAVGDGVADDAVAYKAAALFAETYNYGLLWPDAGTYRVTSGWTNARTGFSNLSMVGTSNEGCASIVLDSTDPARFFYDYTGGGAHRLTVDGLAFSCTQLVQDSDFFRITSSSINTCRFTNLAFGNTNRPIVYKAGTYSEQNVFENIIFFNSGTVYSDSNVGSRGNMFSFTNVASGGTQPENTAKQVMNLQGIRGIEVNNFLLQGALPSSGWTILHLDNEYNADWTQSILLQANGYWSEWVGANPPLNTLVQKGGRTVWINAAFGAGLLSGGTVRKISLDQSAQMHVIGSSFMGEVGETVNQIFTFADTSCHVTFERCAFRGVIKTEQNMTFSECSYAPDGSAGNVAVRSARFGTNIPSTAFRWSGGYPVADGCTVTLGGGTTYTPSTKATYGRMISVIPNVNTCQIFFNVPIKGVINIGTQYNITVLCKLPTFVSGSFNIYPTEDAALVAGQYVYGPAESGTVVAVNISRLNATAVSTVGLRFSTASATGVAGNLEIYAMEFSVGDNSPRAIYPQFNTNITTRNSATPTAGAWSLGDVVWFTSPSSAAAPGTVCVASGTPGTWADMAVLA